MISIKPIDPAEIAALTLDAQVIEQDAHGIKVQKLPDGRFLKYFRRKRFVNRDLLAPAAIRFARKARRLQQLGIPTLDIVGLHRVTGQTHTIAIYRPLPGETLRDLLIQEQAEHDLMYRVGVFIARLHRLGIYFRSLHPGNIVITGMRPGLIDVLDMKFRPWSLTRWERRRNWLHFLRCEQDRPYLQPEQVDELLLGYSDAADLPRYEVHRENLRIRYRLFS